MRELLFRGKRIGTNTWIEGGLVQLDEEYTLIIPPYLSGSTMSVRDILKYTCELVDPETVGQYIGLKDRNGKKIFEGDILKDSSGTYKIYYDECYQSFQTILIDGSYDFIRHYCDYLGGYTVDADIIGNVYDNPELT